LNYSLLLNDEQVRVSSVFGLDVQTIVIDPGHGGKDPGAIGSLGTNEKDIVLDIGLQLRDALTRSGRYNVVMTRERDVFISLADRVRVANANRTDLFISLHVNAIPQKEYNVTETFYFGPPTDKYTLRLAEQENRGSEIQAGDFKNMIKKISDTMKEQESALLAASIQQSLFSNMKKHDSTVSDNGIKIAPFVVLLGVDAPSVLVEISCITKKDEEANLQKTEYRKQITSFIKEGVTSYLGQRHLQIVEGEHNGQKNNKKSS
ncbi:MAG: N-acetylmuramoyl-L-alanine amidase, partial [Desulfobulbaceae bacterium]|nr:N-acetylmuramoyl-L-alanine amidase [Desulfobulbaceae bacterium]